MDARLPIVMYSFFLFLILFVLCLQKETNPEAAHEFARQQRLRGGDNSLARQTSYTTDEERREKVGPTTADTNRAC